MKFSSFLHHVSFAASVSSSTAIGQGSHRFRKDGNTILSLENEDKDGAISHHKRANLRDRHLVQNNSGTEAHLLDEWMNEIDSQMSTLEAWVLEKQNLCAWGSNVLGETLDWTSKNNKYFPSFDTNYWVTSFKIKDLASSTIKLTGKPPKARYYSLQTYTQDDHYSSVVGALVDVDITLAADGSFTILINNGEDTGDLAVNSLRGLPNGANTGTIVLMYRTYLPVPLTSPAGGVNLPLISIQMGLDDELRELEYCDEVEPIIEIADPTEYKTMLQLPKVPSAITYFRTTGGFTPYPNDDIAYLATDSLIFPVKGYTVVARGKAPTFHNGHAEKPQVRYWSMCKLSLPSTKTISCLTDEDAILDSEGRYVIVVAPERPSGTGFDYLNFGPSPIGVLALRNMLPSPEFYNMSTQNVNSKDKDADIRRKMGEFYPETVYCSITTIEEQGVEECFL